MRALEKYLGLSGLNYNAEKKIAVFKERIPKVKACVDSSAPRSLGERESMSPGKRHGKKVERNRLIALDNMLLARRIFNIMEAPGALHDVIADTRHLDSHAGTMNFPHRLEEAQRIHRHNQLIATRLDNVKGVLMREDLYSNTGFNPLEAKSQRCREKMQRMADLRARRSQAPPEWNDAPLHSARGEDASAVRRAQRQLRQQSPNRTAHMPAPSGSQSARRAEEPHSTASGLQPNSARSSSPTPRVPSAAKSRPIRILLEYTKIQAGKVLDLAVVKEPFRDRFAVFGIDIDGGQRYELRLTSEDVSSILDGDMLVTSIDSLEVWVALLNKIVLEPVAEFTKLPTHENPEEIIRNTASTQGRGVRPVAPSSRPSSKARGSRPGSRVQERTSSAAAADAANASAEPETVELEPQRLQPRPPSVPPPSAAPAAPEGDRPRTAPRSPSRPPSAPAPVPAPAAAEAEEDEALSPFGEPLDALVQQEYEEEGAVREVPEEEHLSPAKEVGEPAGFASDD